MYISVDLGINNIFNVNYAQSVLINAVGFGEQNLAIITRGMTEIFIQAWDLIINYEFIFE